MRPRTLANLFLFVCVCAIIALPAVLVEMLYQPQLTEIISGRSWLGMLILVGLIGVGVLLSWPILYIVTKIFFPHLLIKDPLVRGDTKKT